MSVLTARDKWRNFNENYKLSAYIECNWFYQCLIFSSSSTEGISVIDCYSDIVIPSLFKCAAWRKIVKSQFLEQNIIILAPSSDQWSFPWNTLWLRTKKKICVWIGDQSLVAKKERSHRWKVSKETVVLHQWERSGVLQDYNITWFNELSCWYKLANIKVYKADVESIGPSFEQVYSLQWRANAWNVSLRISLWWPIHIII